jgi:hypothetical protein
MITAAPEDFQMKITACRAGKALPKIFDSAGLKMEFFVFTCHANGKKRLIRKLTVKI